VYKLQVTRRKEKKKTRDETTNIKKNRLRYSIWK
jgi:hypothetical protein